MSSVFDELLCTFDDMKAQIESRIHIKAPVELVWQVLSDFNAYPHWSPTIKLFKGVPTVGKRSKVLLTQPGGTSIEMNPIFLNIQPNKELRWKGRLWFNGLFDGEHYFTLNAITDEECILIQGELFKGLLVPLFKRMIEGNTLAGFRLFNEAIRSRSEDAFKDTVPDHLSLHEQSQNHPK